MILESTEFLKITLISFYLSLKGGFPGIAYLKLFENKVGSGGGVGGFGLR